MTTPDQIRKGLRIVTSAAIREVRSVAALGESPAAIRASLFEAAPLIVGDYIDGSAALALDWYEELRDEANPRRGFAPHPVTAVDQTALATSTAWATEPLYALDQDPLRATEDLLARATRESLTLLEPIIQKSVATGYWDTIVTNSRVDPASAGWKRFAQPGACKFCRMCAARGAVYTQATADFAAHTTCHCIAGPEFGGQGTWAEATPIQYLASQRTRTEKERADLREYLNHNFPDAPG